MIDKLLIISCARCGKEFKSKSRLQKYCGEDCAKSYIPRERFSRVCSFCGGEFKTTRPQKKFCSIDCRRIFTQNEYRKRNLLSAVSSGTRGAIGELTICVDLLSKGYEVFRSVSPTSSCDLAILKDGKLLKVEVRTGYRSRSGNLMFKKTDRGHDIYAVVIGNNTMYIPPLPE